MQERISLPHSHDAPMSQWTISYQDCFVLLQPQGIHMLYQSFYKPTAVTIAFPGMSCCVVFSVVVICCKVLIIIITLVICLSSIVVAFLAATA